MRRFAAFALLTALAFVGSPIAQSQETRTANRDTIDDTKNPGWVSLFDGKTMSGWEMLEMSKPGSSKWEVVDGLLVGSGQPSMLYSPRGDYHNFRYRAELKINDKGNSGMYIRTPKKATFMDGYEIQVNSTHGDPVKTGSIYTFVEVFEQIIPADTFFTQEIEARDVKYRGKDVTEITIKINDKVLYKFRDFNKTYTTGHFAFQQHDPGSKVTIKKVEVMELK